VKTPEEMPYGRHVYHIYAIRVPNRPALMQALQEREIQSGIHYPYPVHLLPAHADLGYKAGDFPKSEAIANEVLSLPMYAELSDEQIREVGTVVRESIAHLQVGGACL
jgi:dTDP-4-amino-4,6-dideoxygalactose transaminase